MFPLFVFSVLSKSIFLMVWRTLPTDYIEPDLELRFEFCFLLKVSYCLRKCCELPNPEVGLEFIPDVVLEFSEDPLSRLSTITERVYGVFS